TCILFCLDSRAHMGSRATAMRIGGRRGRIALAAASALVILASVPAQAAATPTWLSSQPLSKSGLGAFGPTVALAPSGEATALWYGAEVSSGELVQASSRPPGGAWTPPTDLPEEEGGMRPDIASAGAGAVAIWQFDAPTEERVESAVRSATGVWSGSQTISGT